jgi:hypothetical protein
MLFRDLPEATQVSFLKAYLDSYRWRDLLDEHPEIRDAQVSDEDAYRDAERLRNAMEMVYSAALFELADDAAAYDEVAEELNAKYGEGFVVMYPEGALGLRGFRIPPFGRMTEWELQPDGTMTEQVTDLAAEARRRDEADLGNTDDQ